MLCELSRRSADSLENIYRKNMEWLDAIKATEDESVYYESLNTLHFCNPDSLIVKNNPLLPKNPPKQRLSILNIYDSEDELDQIIPDTEETPLTETRLEFATDQSIESTPREKFLDRDDIRESMCPAAIQQIKLEIAIEDKYGDMIKEAELRRKQFEEKVHNKQ